MAKKTVATFKSGEGGRTYSKVIKIIKSPKTDTYIAGRRSGIRLSGRFRDPFRPAGDDQKPAFPRTRENARLPENERGTF